MNRAELSISLGPEKIEYRAACGPQAAWNEKIDLVMSK
jgi:hypothetical protein